MWPSHDKLAAAARGCGVQHPFPLLFTGPKDLGRSGLINWYEGRNRTASGRVTRRARIANRCAGALILFLFDVDVLEFWCWVVMLFRSWFAIRAPKARTGRERSQTQKSRRTSLGERWAVNEAPARATRPATELPAPRHRIVSPRRPAKARWPRQTRKWPVLLAYLRT